MPADAPQPTPQMVAAVDLGSNSFHMIVAQVDDGHMRITDRLKEMVRLGAGLRPDKRLDPEVEDRAIACLERFGQRLRSLPPGAVRAVGTNTLRQIAPESGFVERAETALGHPVDVIAGREEARLIYLGVAHGLAAGTERRLVVDIGGGSTEIIIGMGFAPRLRESLHMGCVSMSQRYFADGKISPRAMEKATLAGALEVRPVRELFRQHRWQTAVGTSGTIRAIAAVIRAEGWCDDGISASALTRLRQTIVARGRVSALDFKGLSDERRPVFAGGVAVLCAVFETLGIEHLQVCDYALREGLIYEMAGRNQLEDVRERTVATLSRQFQIDQAHAQRVRASALDLLRQLAAPWSLQDPAHALMLGWAARLHEIGLLVAHSQYQKHGAYLLRNADLPGFTHREQAVLAALVLGHRRKFPTQEIQSLPKSLRERTECLCLILRLAVLMRRARSTEPKPCPDIETADRALTLHFPAGWLDAHPLNRLELEQEAERLTTAGFSLRFT
ncbi:Ppx/GppA phosphatase family protein [Marichromatium bheemlicum]|uniref:Ppx/GppA family phosphatase n=1 Tax=Marichromatium bheemlicum TaxID=365339 RepID=A0ABX1IAH5_9GAMM|nr:Ppx/GppA phosphatase family protein [Marichromatium bheemlicum]NKN34535.1 Ppx/GppA family phosphatase [Marichromatium bheemlicum]